MFELEEDLGIANLAIAPEDGLLIVAVDDMRQPQHPEIRCLTIEGIERARFRLDMLLYSLTAVDARTLAMIGAFKHSGQIEVLVIEAASGRVKARRALGPEIGADVACSPTGDRLAVAHHHGVEVCGLKTLDPLLHLGLGDETACSLALSPDGAWIAAGTLEQTVRLFNADTGEEHLV